MPALFRMLLLIFLALPASCSGPNAAGKTPGHMQAGHKEIKKGAAWHQRGCYNRALEHFFRAYELFTASYQTEGIALSLNNIGNVYRTIGDTESALLFFDESHGVYKTMNDRDGTLRVLTGKAAALIAGDRLDQAEGVLNSIAKMIEKTEAAPPMFLNVRGILHFRRKEFNRAENFLMRALKKTSTEDVSLYATINHALGNLMRETGRLGDALRYFETALAADRRAGFYQGIAGDLEAIGKTHLQQNRHAAAANAFSRCIQIYAWMGKKKKVMENLDLLEATAQTAGGNTRVTLHFVNQWLKGERLEAPCE